MKSEAERLIVHLDEDLAVIEKPAGLVVHSAPSHKGETLVDLLEGIAGGGEGGRPGIVQRMLCQICLAPVKFLSYPAGMMPQQRNFCLY